MFVGSLWLVLAIFVTLGFIMWRRWPKRVPILAADGSGKRLTTDSSADLSAGYSLFAGTVVQVKNPSLAREVLVEKADNFVRWIPFVPKGGLFTSEGDEYKRHHKVLSSAMRRDFITSLNGVIDRTAEDLILNIQKNQSSSGSIDDTFELIYKQVSKSILTLTYGDTPLARELVAASAEMFGRDLSSLATLLPTGLAKCIPIPSVQKRVNNAQTARRYLHNTHFYITLILTSILFLPKVTTASIEYNSRKRKSRGSGRLQGDSLEYARTGKCKRGFDSNRLRDFLQCGWIRGGRERLDFLRIDLPHLPSRETPSCTNKTPQSPQG